MLCLLYFKFKSWDGLMPFTVLSSLDIRNLLEILLFAITKILQLRITCHRCVTQILASQRKVQGVRTMGVGEGECDAYKKECTMQKKHYFLIFKGKSFKSREYVT